MPLHARSTVSTLSPINPSSINLTQQVTARTSLPKPGPRREPCQARNLRQELMSLLPIQPMELVDCSRRLRRVGMGISDWLIFNQLGYVLFIQLFLGWDLLSRLISLCLICPFGGWQEVIPLYALSCIATGCLAVIPLSYGLILFYSKL